MCVCNGTPLTVFLARRFKGLLMAFLYSLLNRISLFSNYANNGLYVLLFLYLFGIGGIRVFFSLLLPMQKG